MLGRVFLDLGDRGGRMQKWSYEVVAGRGRVAGASYELWGDVGGLLTDCCIDAGMLLPRVVGGGRIGGWEGLWRCVGGG